MHQSIVKLTEKLKHVTYHENYKLTTKYVSKKQYDS